MARNTPLFPIALSPQGVADSLGIDICYVTDAIKNSELPLYEFKRSKRIPVMAAVHWIETYWVRVGENWARPKPKRKRRHGR